MNYLEWLEEAQKMSKGTLYTAQVSRAERVMSVLKDRYGDRVSFAGVSHDYHDDGSRRIGLAFRKDGKERVAHLDPKRTEKEWNDYSKAKPGLAPRSKIEAARLFHGAMGDDEAARGPSPKLPDYIKSGREAAMIARAVRERRGRKVIW